MSSKDAVSFVGLHASFPIRMNERRPKVLESLLALEGSNPFKKVKYGQILGKLRTAPYSADLVKQILHAISTGDVDDVSFISYWKNADWVQAYETSVGVHWNSSNTEPLHRPLSPVEERFGFAGIVTVEYPLSRFSIDSESPFQGKLLNLMKRLFVEQSLHYAFIHKGSRPIAPFSIGTTDDVFLRTRDRFPLSSFYMDLLVTARYFREYVKGAFWATFLNPIHVGRLGGLKRITEENPSLIVENLGHGGALLQVGPSPLPSNEIEAIEDYQRLRRFLQSIALETEDELERLHKTVIGNWKAPELSEREWKKVLANLQKPERPA